MSGLAATSFLALIEDLRLNQQRSPWAKVQGVDGWTDQLSKEVAEVREAVQEASADDLHLGEEMGDVLWTWIAAAIVLEERGGPSMDAIIVNAQAKLRRRKPWVFDKTATLPSTPEEENKIYLEMKRVAQ